MTNLDDQAPTLALVGPVDATDCLAHWLPLLCDWTGGCLVAEVGSTGISGLTTKGDVDVVVVAPDPTSWQEAVVALRVQLTPHEPQHWSMTWASFRGASAAGEVGVQVVLADSEEDQVLRGFRALLLHDRAVVERYAALKLRHLGGPVTEYRAAKGVFVEAELACRD